MRKKPREKRETVIEREEGIKCESKKKEEMGRGVVILK